MGIKLQQVVRKLCTELSKNLRCRLITRNDGKPYLERYYILSSRISRFLPGIYLHRFLSGDEDPELHNHPWDSSISVILNGSYREERRDENDETSFKDYSPGSINFIKKNDFHRVDLLSHDVWTLFISGNREQDWGFWNQKTGEYTQWEEHIRKKKRKNGRSKFKGVAGTQKEILRASF